jgi:hypothetical protein
MTMGAAQVENSSDIGGTVQMVQEIVRSFERLMIASRA